MVPIKMLYTEIQIFTVVDIFCVYTNKKKYFAQRNWGVHYNFVCTAQTRYKKKSVLNCCLFIYFC